jgi:D-sedoheptulose 7-phosphate isomerase
MSFVGDLAAAWPQTTFDARDIAAWMSDCKRVIFIGNGGSAAIASHMAADFAKNGNMPALCFNDAAAITCLANDYSYEEVFAKPLAQHVTETDCLVAISSSGRSRNILNGVLVAREKHASIMTLTGFDPGNPLRALGQKNIHVESHDYGVVETAHLGMLHAVIAEIIRAR